MNQYSKGAWTPLHLAVKSGHTDLMELLMKSNADVNAKTSDGFTPLVMAVCHQQVDAARKLLALGVSACSFKITEVGKQ